jgi:hypothetical protein
MASTTHAWARRVIALVADSLSAGAAGGRASATSGVQPAVICGPKANWRTGSPSEKRSRDAEIKRLADAVLRDETSPYPSMDP